MTQPPNNPWQPVPNGQQPPAPQWGQPHGGQPQWGGQPGQGYLTGPPPQKRTGYTVIGWVLLVFGGLMVLGRIASTVNGTRTPAANAAAALGGIVALVLFAVLPIVFGLRLIGKHGREMTAWRQREAAAAQQASLTQQPFGGQQFGQQGQPYPPQQFGQPYPTQQPQQQFPPRQ